jgi:hypothetical protein
LENHGYVSAFMSELNQQIKSMDEESFRDIYKFIFTAIRAKYQSDLTIFDSHVAGYLDIISNILNESDELKELFIKNRNAGMAWIPGPGGINLEKGIGSCTGDLLEKTSILGPFFSVSFLPNSLTLKPDERFNRTAEKFGQELRQAKS